jgi:hypothetical protein
MTPETETLISMLRATQKAIERQHATAFTPEAIEELTRAAIAHYGAA